MHLGAWVTSVNQDARLVPTSGQMGGKKNEQQTPKPGTLYSRSEGKNCYPKIKSRGHMTGVHEECECCAGLVLDEE